MKASIGSSLSSYRALCYRIQKRMAQGIFVLLTLGCAGCQAPRTAGFPSNISAPSTGTLEPGDVVRISFTGARQHDLVQKIRPDGRISLPLVGEVRAAGRNVAALQSDLGRLYKPQ